MGLRLRTQVFGHRIDNLKIQKKQNYWTILIEIDLRTILSQKLWTWFWVRVPLHCKDGYVPKNFHFDSRIKKPILLYFHRVLKHFLSSKLKQMLFLNNWLGFLREVLKWNCQVCGVWCDPETDYFLHATRTWLYRKLKKNSKKILMSTFKSDLKSKHRPLFSIRNSVGSSQVLLDFENGKNTGFGACVWTLAHW